MQGGICHFLSAPERDPDCVDSLQTEAILMTTQDRLSASHDRDSGRIHAGYVVRAASEIASGRNARRFQPGQPITSSIRRCVTKRWH